MSKDKVAMAWKVQLCVFALACLFYEDLLTSGTTELLQVYIFANNVEKYKSWFITSQGFNYDLSLWFPKEKAYFIQLGTLIPNGHY